MSKKKVEETIIYQEKIPEQIVEKFEDGQKVQYCIWDALIKRLSNLHPELLLPVVKEVFGKQYRKEEEITFLSTEYVVDTLEKSKNQRWHSIYADLVFRIGEKDIYHLECQIRPNSEMVLRMFKYDVQIAFQHGTAKAKDIKKIKLEMPRSVIMYLTHTKYTPDKETMEISLPNGKVWKYCIPTLKVQNYSVEEIDEKELYFLIPLTCIRYYSKENKKVRKNMEPSLTQFLGQCMMKISEAIKNQKLTGRSGKDILDCFQRGCHYLFAEDEETKREVQQMLEPYFKLEREIWQEETEERLKEEITKRVKEEVTKRVTEEVTERVTEEVTERVTEEVTERVTEEVTERVTEEVTERVTEEVTERVTEEVTERVTEEVTERVTEKLIRSLKDCGVTREIVKKQLIKEYELNEADAEIKMKLYFE